MYRGTLSLPERLSHFMYAVYGMMSLGLAVTAVTAYFLNEFYIKRAPSLADTIFSSPLIMTLIFIAQLALVFILSLWINRMTVPMAAGMFLLYAASLGITLAAIFYIYTDASIVQTFVVTAGMFGFMALYGYFTKSDLTSMGNFLMMGLFGLIIAMIVNLFFRSPVFDLLLSGAGVILFTLLTAYDAQRIKQFGLAVINQGASYGQAAIMGALILYLDFINLFLFLLRFTGARRQE